MMMKRHPAKEAADAMSALHVMACVVDMLGSGAVKGGSKGCERAAQRIIKICQKEQLRQLIRYDAELLKLGIQPPR